MVQYILSEAEAYYLDAYKGHFSKKMAEWAISMMEKKDEVSGKLKPIIPYSLDEVEEMLKSAGVKLDETCLYDAWYLANMAKADHLGSSLEDKQHVALYVKDTLCDPDGEPEMVLACFRAKCDVKGVPIYWERML